ncbi:MAG: DinB family protein [Thermoanaerobaculia bacterium]
MQILEIAPFLEYFERLRDRTRRVVAAIPHERLDWTYRPGKFTCADIVRHLAAIERWMYAENVQGKPSRYAGHGPEIAEGYPDLTTFLESLHADAMTIFAGLTPQDLAGKCLTPAGTSITTWKWLRAMVEHEVHHRGQLYVYAGMMGLEGPPLYGLTSEEVRSRSATQPSGD